jgi:hypothetical protein
LLVFLRADRPPLRAKSFFIPLLRADFPLFPATSRVFPAVAHHNAFVCAVHKAG